MVILKLIEEEGFMFLMINFGGYGLFVMMIVLILLVEIFRFCKVKNVIIKMLE